jgi:hypothetical protein
MTTLAPKFERVLLAGEFVELGPHMRALPTDRQRLFVLRFADLPPGRGRAVKAARLAGFGRPDGASNKNTMAALTSRLLADPRISQAMAEVGRQRLGALGLTALSAACAVLENPKHASHAKVIATILSHAFPTEHNIAVSHTYNPPPAATEEVLRRIEEIAAAVGVNIAALPPLLIDVTPAPAEEPEPA